MQSAATATRGTAADTAQLRVRGIPGGDSHPVGTGGLGVGVTVEPARADETRVCGAGGGHHGVRKGTHGSFVGSVFNSLEVFGEKHTKG